MFLATDDDDFNALASVVMQDNVEGPVYRVGPPHGSHGVVAPYTGGDILFGRSLVRHVLAERYERGARFVVQPASAPLPPSTTRSSWCGPTTVWTRSPRDSSPSFRRVTRSFSSVPPRRPPDSEPRTLGATTTRPWVSH